MSTGICEVCGLDGFDSRFLPCLNVQACGQGRHVYCLDIPPTALVWCDDGYPDLSRLGKLTCSCCGDLPRQGTSRKKKPRPVATGLQEKSSRSSSGRATRSDSAQPPQLPAQGSSQAPSVEAPLAAPGEGKGDGHTANRLSGAAGVPASTTGSASFTTILASSRGASGSAFGMPSAQQQIVHEVQDDMDTTEEEDAVEHEDGDQQGGQEGSGQDLTVLSVAALKAKAQADVRPRPPVGAAHQPQPHYHHQHHSDETAAASAGGAAAAAGAEAGVSDGEDDGEDDRPLKRRRQSASGGEPALVGTKGSWPLSMRGQSLLPLKPSAERQVSEGHKAAVAADPHAGPGAAGADPTSAASTRRMTNPADTAKQPGASDADPAERRESLTAPGNLQGKKGLCKLFSGQIKGEGRHSQFVDKFETRRKRAATAAAAAAGPKQPGAPHAATAAGHPAVGQGAADDGVAPAAAGGPAAQAAGREAVAAGIGSAGPVGAETNPLQPVQRRSSIGVGQQTPHQAEHPHLQLKPSGSKGGATATSIPMASVPTAAPAGATKLPGAAAAQAGIAASSAARGGRGHGGGRGVQRLPSAGSARRVGAGAGTGAGAGAGIGTGIGAGPGAGAGVAAGAAGSAAAVKLQLSGPAPAAGQVATAKAGAPLAATSAGTGAAGAGGGAGTGAPAPAEGATAEAAGAAGAGAGVGAGQARRPPMVPSRGRVGRGGPVPVGHGRGRGPMPGRLQGASFDIRQHLNKTTSGGVCGMAPKSQQQAQQPLLGTVQSAGAVGAPAAPDPGLGATGSGPLVPQQHGGVLAANDKRMEIDRTVYWKGQVAFSDLGQQAQMQQQKPPQQLLVNLSAVKPHLSMLSLTKALKDRTHSFKLRPLAEVPPDIVKVHEFYQKNMPCETCLIMSLVYSIGIGAKTFEGLLKMLRGDPDFVLGIELPHLNESVLSESPTFRRLLASHAAVDAAGGSSSSQQPTYWLYFAPSNVPLTYAEDDTGKDCLLCLTGSRYHVQVAARWDRNLKAPGIVRRGEQIGGGRAAQKGRIGWNLNDGDRDIQAAADTQDGQASAGDEQKEKPKLLAKKEMSGEKAKDVRSILAHRDADQADEDEAVDAAAEDAAAAQQEQPQGIRGAQGAHEATEGREAPLATADVAGVTAESIALPQLTPHEQSAGVHHEATVQHPHPDSHEHENEHGRLQQHPPDCGHEVSGDATGGGRRDSSGVPDGGRHVLHYVTPGGTYGTDDSGSGYDRQLHVAPQELTAPTMEGLAGVTGRQAPAAVLQQQSSPCRVYELMHQPAALDQGYAQPAAGSGQVPDVVPQPAPAWLAPSHQQPAPGLGDSGTGGPSAAAPTSAAAGPATTKAFGQPPVVPVVSLAEVAQDRQAATAATATSGPVPAQSAWMPSWLRSEVAAAPAGQSAPAAGLLAPPVVPLTEPPLATASSHGAAQAMAAESAARGAPAIPPADDPANNAVATQPLNPGCPAGLGPGEADKQPAASVLVAAAVVGADGGYLRAEAAAAAAGAGPQCSAGLTHTDGTLVDDRNEGGLLLGPHGCGHVGVPGAFTPAVGDGWGSGPYLVHCRAAEPELAGAPPFGCPGHAPYGWPVAQDGHAGTSHFVQHQPAVATWASDPYGGADSAATMQASGGIAARSTYVVPPPPVADASNAFGEVPRAVQGDFPARVWQGVRTGGSDPPKDAAAAPGPAGPGPVVNEAPAGARGWDLEPTHPVAGCLAPTSTTLPAAEARGVPNDTLGVPSEMRQECPLDWRYLGSADEAGQLASRAADVSCELRPIPRQQWDRERQWQQQVQLQERPSISAARGPAEVRQECPLDWRCLAAPWIASMPSFLAADGDRARSGGCQRNSDEHPPRQQQQQTKCEADGGGQREPPGSLPTSSRATGANVLQPPQHPRIVGTGAPEVPWSWQMLVPLLHDNPTCMGGSGSPRIMAAAPGQAAQSAAGAAAKEASFSWSRVKLPIVQLAADTEPAKDSAFRQTLRCQLTQLWSNLQVVPELPLRVCNVHVLATDAEWQHAQPVLSAAAEVLGLAWSRASPSDPLLDSWENIQVLAFNPQSVAVDKNKRFILKSIAVNSVGLYMLSTIVEGLNLLVASEQEKAAAVQAGSDHQLRGTSLLLPTPTFGDVLAQAAGAAARLAGIQPWASQQPLYPNRLVVVMDAQGFLGSEPGQLQQLFSCLEVGSRAWGEPWQMHMRAADLQAVRDSTSQQHRDLLERAAQPGAAWPLVIELCRDVETSQSTVRVIRDATNLMGMKRPGRVVVAAYSGRQKNAEGEDNHGESELKSKDILAGEVGEVVAFLGLMLAEIWGGPEPRAEEP